MLPHAREYSDGELIPGTKFRVVRKIGAGGMGTVYDVEDTSIGKLYVLKALHPQLGDREDLQIRLQKEARVLAKLHHPNIVEVITAGITHDAMHLPYYVMERLSGQSLRLILEKKQHVDLPHALHIAIDLMDALWHAHDQGVVHRDVKPDNIFLHRTHHNVTVTKLLDFGIMSLLDPGLQRETAGRFLGTLRYASPEQLRGDNPTPQMDLYAAALVLYEMVAGRGPFAEVTHPQEIVRHHMEVPPPPLSMFVNDVPRELVALVAAALSKIPAARPRDAFSFAASLRNIKNGLSSAGRAVPVVPTNTNATGPVVVAPHPAPYVDVRAGNTPGSVVVAPAAPVAVEPPPRTTVRGMPIPTVGLGPAPIVTASGNEPVDRSAPTHTHAAHQITPGQEGTEGMAPPGMNTMRAYPLPDVLGPIHWPPEPPLARSDDAHVRSVDYVPPRTPVRAVWVMALSASLGLGVLAAVLVVARSRGSSHPAAAASTVAAPATVAPPPPTPVVLPPVPTLAPPAFDDPGASSTAAIATASVSAAAPVATSAPSARPVARPKPKPSATPTAGPASTLGERPGPGF
jgi:serine/threonine-protein kinase